MMMLFCSVTFTYTIDKKEHWGIKTVTKKSQLKVAETDVTSAIGEMNIITVQEVWSAVILFLDLFGAIFLYTTLSLITMYMMIVIRALC